MQHKRKDCSCHRKRQYCIRHITHTQEAECKGKRSKDTVTRAESIHAINQVDRVDNTHAREDCQRHCDIPRQPADTPQTVEIVDIDTAQEHHQADHKYLQRKTQTRRELQDIVTHTSVEHNKHCDNQLKLDVHTLDIISRHTQAKHYTEEYTYSTQYRNRHLI